MADIINVFGEVNPCKEWYESLAPYNKLPLWPKGETPGYRADDPYPEPSLVFFPAPGAKKRGCVLVMAGGSYTSKAAHEGIAVAKQLNQAGIHAAVLDYRLTPYEKEWITLDAKRALRYLKYHEDQFGIDGNHLAVLGFSAGGNLAGMCCFQADDGDPQAGDPIDRLPARPSAAVLCYPAFHFVEAYEQDDEFNLLSYFDIRREDCHYAPPTFLWQSFEDTLIPYANNIELVRVLRDKEVPVELHIFPHGPHGQGLATFESTQDENFLTSAWVALCMRWLHQYGF